MEGSASITEDATFWVPSEGPPVVRALGKGTVALGLKAPALWDSLLCWVYSAVTTLESEMGMESSE